MWWSRVGTDEKPKGRDATSDSVAVTAVPRAPSSANNLDSENRQVVAMEKRMAEMTRDLSVRI